MLLDTLLYGFGLPLVLTVLLFLFRGIHQDPNIGATLVPALSVCVGYFGLVGVPGAITTNALSGLVYGTVLLVLFGILDSFVSPEGWLVNSARIVLFVLLFVLIFYPRYVVLRQPLLEAAQGTSVIVLGFLGGVLRENHPAEGGFRWIFQGLYFTAVSVFLGIYTSFLVAQLTLTVAVAYFCLTGLAYATRSPVLDVDTRIVETGFPVLLLLYTLFFTTLSFTTVLLLTAGGYLIVLAELPILRGRRILGKILVVIALGILLAGGTAVEESYFTGEEESSAYRPYR